MRFNEIYNTLQNLIKTEINQAELGRVLGVSRANINYKKQADVLISDDDVKKIETYYDVDLLQHNNAIQSNSDNVTLDYFPDIEVSCGNGIIPFGETKGKMTVPVNLIKGYSKNNKYVIVSATSDSMQPEIKPNDMLIIRVTDSDTIIDNHIYVFCYNERLYCKYLSYNVNQIIVRSANKDYPTRFIEKENINDFKLCGEVCGLMRDLR